MRLNFISSMLIIFFTTLSSCSLINNITYQGKEGIFGFSDWGTYTDGTALFRVDLDIKNPYSKLCLLHLNGNFTCIDEISYPIPNYKLIARPLNPNYILINDGNEIIIANWEGKRIDSLPIRPNVSYTLETSWKNDSRFLILHYGIGIAQPSYYEYIIDNGQIAENGNSTFNPTKYTQFKIVSLKDAWGIILSCEVNCDGSLITVSAKSLEPIGTIIGIDTITDCIGDSTLQYCLCKGFNSYSVIRISSQQSERIEINSFLPKSGVQCFSDRQNVFLFMYYESSSIKYYTLNTEILFTNINNTFGEFEIRDKTFEGLGVIPKLEFLNQATYVIQNSVILPNETVVHSINISPNIIFLSIDLSQMIPKYILYDNPHIKQVNPLNDKISIGTSEISLTFVHPIDLTIPVNISIHRKYNDNKKILRQIILCSNKHCTISEDRYKLTINLPIITFNEPSALYYVEIDDGFLINGDRKIPGIKSDKWIIETGENSRADDVDSDFVIGIICLTAGGSNNYSSNKDGQGDFIKEMMKEISESIPVDESSLTHLDRFFEYDKFEETEILFIQFKISSSEDGFNKKSAKYIFETFNNLLSNTDDDIKTFLDIGNYTRYINKKFGVRKSSNLWEEIKNNLKNFIEDKTYMGFLIFIIILPIALYIFGRYRYKEGQNFIAFKVTLIIFDIVNDIIFVATEKNKLKESSLLIPSIVFVSFPFFTNAALVFYIIHSEIKKYPEFRKWFDDNDKWIDRSKLIAMITLFGSGNVELLHLINSQFANFSIFSAPFSSEALNWIFWGGFIDILIEDLPQLIIQILYAAANNTSFDYSMIAFLTLITSSIILTIDIIGFIYGIMRKCGQTVTTYSSNVCKTCGR